MPRLLVRNFSISLDGYAAGPHQDLDHPLGIGGTQLHEWIFATPVSYTHLDVYKRQVQGCARRRLVPARDSGDRGA